MVISSNRPTSPPVAQLTTPVGSVGVTSSSSANAYNQQAHKLFSENFWGDKINGFDVLCQNLKHSLISVKDLEVFLRECANGEDTYVKNLNKLVSQANKYSTSANAGSFNPLWLPLKEINEKFASSHLQLVHQLQELIKEIQRYNEELGKKIKRIRENETQTQNLVQMFQEIQQTLNKTKDQYQNLCIEFDKQKRQLDPQQMAQYQQLSQQQSTTSLMGLSALATSLNAQSNVNSNLPSSSNLQGLSNENNNSNLTAADRLTSLATSITANKVTHVQKLEKKMKLCLEDYKTSIDKYNSIRVEYERKLVDSCNNFQYAEETHLKQMRSFIEAFSKLIANINSNKQQIYHEFQLKFTEQYTTDYLIQIFIENKRTGSERPDIAQLVEQFDHHSYSTNTSVNSNGFVQISSPTPTPTSNLIINEIDFNLVINGNTSSNSAAISTTGSSSTSSQNLIGGFSSQSLTSAVNSSSFNASNAIQSQISQQSLINKSDLVDGRGGDRGGTGTPVFFNSSNLMIGGGSSNGLYSQLTNANSSTALNSTGISNNNLNPVINLSANNTAASSPINLHQLATPPVVNSIVASDVMKRSDSKGLNIFNVDFLGRNKNKEKKAQKAAAAAAAGANNSTAIESTTTNTTSKSKFSRGIKKKNQPASTAATSVSNNTNQQYESFNTTITSTNSSMFNNVTLSVSNNSNKDSSSLNSEDSNDHKNMNINNTDNLNSSPLTNTKKANVIADSVSNNGSITINNLNSSTNNNHLSSLNINNNNGSVTARSISSITGSLSFDLLDQLKLNGSDIDSEGYSIRPDSASDLRRMNKNSNGEPFKNKDNDDMNNLYGVSSSESDSDDSDSENGDNSSGPVKVMLKIKPIDEVAVKPQNNSDVLRQISKNLQLKPIGLPATLNRPQQSQQQMKKRTYYYNYGTANPDQAPSGWSTSNVFVSTENSNAEVVSLKQKSEQNNLTRSVSTGSVSSNINSQFSNALLLGDFSLDLNPNNNNNKTNIKMNNSSETKKESSLLDLDLTFSAPNTTVPPLASNTSSTNIPVSMSLNKVALENNLYNIDEDKEVESSFQYGQIDSLIKKSATVASSSPMNSSILNPSMQSSSSSVTNQQIMNVSSILNSSTNSNNYNNGRFTPACFPGRTTPIASLSASLFEQGNRASIVSPLTINGSSNGLDIIPIAIEFKEIIHSYFKIGDSSKFKIKCFGSMKISFPFAILKLLAIDLPQLEFRLSNLQIANQDLKINNQLIANTSLFDEELKFKFLNSNLVRELRQQHEQNKQAAFFNFELLKYELKYVQAAPLILNANWSKNIDEKTIELNLDYVFSFRKNLSQVNFLIVMPNSATTKVHLVKSEPNALVQETENKLQVLWQISSLNANGNLKAKFSFNESSTKPVNIEQFFQPIYAKFHVDNETLSQVKFEITSPNYKLSLLKSKIETGKYFCNYDQSQLQQQQQPQPPLSPQQPLINLNSQIAQKKAPFAGNLSTSIGSTVDVLLNY